MATISNRFFVTCLDDNLSIHGFLASDAPAVQWWDGFNPNPSWATDYEEETPVGTADQPTFYLALLAGSTPQTVNDIVAGYKWLYNGQEITFEASPSNFLLTPKEQTPVSGYMSTDGKFFKYNAQRNIKGVDYLVPCLRIIDDMAVSANVDNDTITFDGKYILGGTSVDFGCSANIRLSVLTQSSYLGVIYFDTGLNAITRDNEVIRATGQLFGGAGGGEVDTAWIQWYLNGDPVTMGTNGLEPGLGRRSQGNPLRIKEKDITDHAVLQAEFYLQQTGGTPVCSAYESVDDLTDPEYMYITQDSVSSNSASLRSDQTATFKIWVGTETDSSVPENTPWLYYQVKLLDKEGNTITDTISNIPNANQDGWRSLVLDNDDTVSVPITFATVKLYGMNLSGIVRANTEAWT